MANYCLRFSVLDLVIYCLRFSHKNSDQNGKNNGISQGLFSQCLYHQTQVFEK